MRLLFSFFLMLACPHCQRKHSSGEDGSAAAQAESAAVDDSLPKAESAVVDNSLPKDELAVKNEQASGDTGNTPIASNDTTPLPPEPVAVTVQSLAPETGLTNPIPSQLIVTFSHAIQTPTSDAVIITGTCLPTVSDIVAHPSDAATWTFKLTDAGCTEGQLLTVSVDPTHVKSLTSGKPGSGASISHTYTLSTIGPIFTWGLLPSSLLIPIGGSLTIPFTYAGATQLSPQSINNENGVTVTGNPVCTATVALNSPTSGTVSLSACSGDGDLTIQVKNGLTQDSLGNLSNASSPLSVTIDNTKPTATIAFTGFSKNGLPMEASLSTTETLKPIASFPADFTNLFIGGGTCTHADPIQITAIAGSNNATPLRLQFPAPTCLAGQTFTLGLSTDQTTLTDLAGNSLRADSANFTTPHVTLYSVPAKIPVGTRENTTDLCRNQKKPQCSQAVAMLGYTADNGVFNLPSSYGVPDRPIVGPTGTRLVKQWSDLWIRSLNIGAALSDAGIISGTQSVWTGFEAGGTASSVSTYSMGNCKDWTRSTNNEIGGNTGGIVSKTITTWSNYGEGCNSTSMSILCLCW